MSEENNIINVVACATNKGKDGIINHLKDNIEDCYYYFKEENISVLSNHYCEITINEMKNQIFFKITKTLDKNIIGFKFIIEKEENKEERREQNTENNDNQTIKKLELKIKLITKEFEEHKYNIQHLTTNTTKNETKLEINEQRNIIIYLIKSTKKMLKDNKNDYCINILLNLLLLPELCYHMENLSKISHTSEKKYKYFISYIEQITKWDTNVENNNFFSKTLMYQLRCDLYHGNITFSKYNFISKSKKSNEDNQTYPFYITEDSVPIEKNYNEDKIQFYYERVKQIVNFFKITLDLNMDFEDKFNYNVIFNEIPLEKKPKGLKGLITNLITKIDKIKELIKPNNNNDDEINLQYLQKFANSAFKLKKNQLDFLSKQILNNIKFLIKKNKKNKKNEKNKDLLYSVLKENLEPNERKEKIEKIIKKIKKIITPENITNNENIFAILYQYNYEIRKLSLLIKNIPELISTNNVSSDKQYLDNKNIIAEASFNAIFKTKTKILNNFNNNIDVKSFLNEIDLSCYIYKNKSCFEKNKNNNCTQILKDFIDKYKNINKENNKHNRYYKEINKLLKTDITDIKEINIDVLKNINDIFNKFKIEYKENGTDKLFKMLTENDKSKVSDTNQYLKNIIKYVIINEIKETNSSDEKLIKSFSTKIKRNKIFNKIFTIYTGTISNELKDEKLENKILKEIEKLKKGKNIKTLNNTKKNFADELEKIIKVRSNNKPSTLLKNFTPLLNLFKKIKSPIINIDINALFNFFYNFLFNKTEKSWLDKNHKNILLYNLKVDFEKIKHDHNQKPLLPKNTLSK
ncbi:hypothetical protein PSOL_04790 [Candidatus Phytoplasma solani]|uniref:hypothetical protein n=1 Tax=Candidatus Phytoplasma solani TaxID=69896 RepID=UPI0032DB1963